MENSSPPDAKRLPAPAHPRQSSSHHAQNLVSGVVTVSVVEALEVIDVNDGNRIRSFETQQGFIEGAACRQRSQFVVISEEVAVLDDRCHQYETSRRPISNADAVDWVGLQAKESRG